MFQEFPEDNKNEDFLNEFRQKIADQSTTSFEEKRNELNRSKSVLIGAVSGVVLAGIVGWFVLSPRYSQNNSDEIPVIRRPQTALKVQPLEPGGMEILNQDKTVYDIIEKKSGDDTNVVENLLPPPEEPKLPEIAPTPEKTVVATNNDVINNIISENVDGATQQIQETIKITETKDIVVGTAPIAQAAINQVEEANLIKISEASKEVITQPVADEKVKQIAAKINEDVKSAPVGVWQLQLMSSPNKKAVETSQGSLTKKYNVLAGQPFEVEVADLGNKGTFYRLKAGAFKDKVDADTLCNDIKALGGSCIVKKK